MALIKKYTDKFIDSSLFILFLSIFSILIGQIPIISPLFNNSSSGLLALWGVLGMFVVPIFSIIFLFKKDVSIFGFRWPKIKDSKFIIYFLSFIFIAIAFLMSFNESFQNYYQLNLSLPEFLWQLVFLSLIYYLSEEFLFRGFMFFGLFRKIGLHSFWVVTLIFTLFHIGKPGIEIVFASIFSLFLCFLSYKTKSFLPAAILHFLVALTLNIMVNFVLI
ncbi:MAG: type II CAAX endopeptidase family protein [Candidatus Paceibacterota bacterium]